MSVMSVSLIPSRDPGAPRRAVAIRVLLLVGILLTALIATILPKASAQDVGQVNSTNSTYYTMNGKCYVETVAATGLDGAGAERFITELTGMLARLGHESNFTFNNGTVTATATAPCPAGTGTKPNVAKEAIDGWIKPALAVVGGLGIVIASSLAFTTVYEKITGHGVDAQSKLQYLMTSLGGSLSTGLLAFATGGKWMPTVSSAVAAFFTTYLVSAYNFQGLQDILKTWLTAFYNGASIIVASIGTSAAFVTTALVQLKRDFATYLAQVRG